VKVLQSLKIGEGKRKLFNLQGHLSFMTEKNPISDLLAQLPPDASGKLFKLITDALAIASDPEKIKILTYVFSNTSNVSVGQVQVDTDTYKAKVDINFDLMSGTDAIQYGDALQYTVNLLFDLMKSLM